MNKKILTTILTAVFVTVVISSIALASTYAVTRVYFNIPSDTSYTIAFPSGYTARSIAGASEAAATLTPEWISFNFSAVPEQWRQPYVNGSSGTGEQTGVSQPIMLIDPTGNVNLTIQIRTNNSSMPTSIAIAFNGSCSPDASYCGSATTAPTTLTNSYQTVVTDLNYSDGSFNLTLYANASSGAVGGEAEIDLLLNATAAS